MPKPTRPTASAIQAEVKKLKEMKPRVRRMTAFSDDNWAAIEAQVRVLEQNLSEDDIWDIWADEYERSAARDALAWLAGEDDETPSENWKSLVQ